MWQVWGDAREPLAIDLDESAAIVMVDSLMAQGRTDVYAENTNGDTYPVE